MAGIGPNDSCQSLLRKLKQGQGALRMSITSIKPPLEVSSASNKILSERKLEKQRRDSMTIQLDKVRKLPKKRARLQQLSPEYEVRKHRPVYCILCVVWCVRACVSVVCVGMDVCSSTCCIVSSVERQLPTIRAALFSSGGKAAVITLHSGNSSETSQKAPAKTIFHSC